MNGFQKHGIGHLSPSSLNQWIGSPSAWVAQRLLKKELGVGIAAHRGTATETGIVFALKGEPIRAAVERAIGQLEDMTRTLGFDADAVSDAKQDVAAMVMSGYEAVLKISDGVLPDFPDGGAQHKVTINCRFGPDPDDTIEFVGYLDFLFQTLTPPLILDLKTTSRLPSDWSLSHGIQAAFYHRGSGINPNVQFLYVSPKNTKVLTLADPAPYLRIIKAHVGRLERFLRLGDADTLAAAVPHDPSSFYWSGPRASAVAAEIFG